MTKANGYKPKHPQMATNGQRIRPMTIRKPSVLLKIRDQHGSAIMAAINGAVNAEEYLKLEQLSEH